MLTIDGSAGEGGGQVLRTSLALSLVSGKPFRITGIRAGRAKPGLMRQHLTAVHAAAAIGRARVEGAEPGSRELTFHPSDVVPGDYSFSVGTAGSTTLVMQSVLPALMLARAPSAVSIEGGTHNPSSPPFDFLARVFLPLLGKLGPKIDATLVRPGFHPAGGGEIRFAISPSRKLGRLELLERGRLLQRRVTATVAGLPRNIAEREVAVIRERLGLEAGECEVLSVRNSSGPGNAVSIELLYENVSELVTAFGKRGTPAEQVAADAAEEARAYIDAGAPVGRHLADQLILPLALGAGGSFLISEPSSHTRTQIETVARFLGPRARLERQAGGLWRVDVG